MKIVELRSENVKRLKAVSIKPDGSLIVVGGRNGQGKSSLLDSISYALGGKDRIPLTPVRRGEKKAQIILNLGDIIVERTFTADGGTALRVKSKEGATFPSPQAMIDKIVGPQFDPREFSELEPRDQLEALKRLVGLDFAEVDEQRRTLYSERTEVNRQLKAAQAQFNACPEVLVPEGGKVSIESLVAEQQAMAQKQRENDAIRTAAGVCKSSVTAWAQNVAETRRHVEKLRSDLKKAEIDLAETNNSLQSAIIAQAEAEKRVAALVDPDLSQTQAKVRDAQTRNAAIDQATAANDRHARQKAAVDQLAERAANLTKSIESIDADKAKQLAEAKFPIDGLGMGDSGVTFNGLPFDQASSAERLRVSMAMGLAMNPQLKVLLIRDGSLLDEESLAVIADMAEQADAQVWIERVGKGGEVSVVIEDGMVQPQANEAPTLEFNAGAAQ